MINRITGYVKIGIAFLALGLVVQAAHAAIYTVASSGGNYSSIQRAIDNSREGDVIYVNSGLYYEDVNVDKRVTLLGRDTGMGLPVVDGMARDGPFRIISNGVWVEGFITQHSGTPCGKVVCAGIFLEGVSHVTVRGNIVRDNDLGIGLFNADMNHIENNAAMNNSVSGINLNHSSHNLISGNVIDGNWNNMPIYTGRSSNGNEITNNTIRNSYPPTIGTDDSQGNIVYLNNFLVKSPSIYMDSNSSISWISPGLISYTYLNKSFSAYLGNYWENYQGKDSNNDGIGDVPHPIGTYNEMDAYPIIGPWNGAAIESPPPLVISSPSSTPTPPPPPNNESGKELNSVLQMILTLLFLLGIASIPIYILSQKKAEKGKGSLPGPAPRVLQEYPHHDVFISYSPQDKPIADAVCSRLETRNIRCWIAPRDVSPGENYPHAIIKGIDESRIMVLIFSSSSNNSPYVLGELTRAVHNESIIIPFRIEDIQPSADMAYLLSLPHWLDALTPPLEKHIENLAETVQYLLKQK
jgi:parallel beta-helix repeat protein